MNTSRTTLLRSCCSAGAILALASAALAQSAPTAPVPPVPPDPITPTNTVTSVSSSWSMTQSNDGRSVTVSSKNGKLSAEIDGKQVPEDRIVQKGNTVTVKDDGGNVVFDSVVPGFDSYSRTLPYRLSASTAPLGALRGRGYAPLSSPSDRTIHITTDAPKVMVGVQLLEPDSSLRGHLGLKEDESTLISAVYEGLPASQAGLEPYDVIVSINGKTPAPPETVRKALRETEAGKPVSLEVIHRGAKKTVSVTVEKYDSEKLEKAKVNAIAAAAGAPTGVAIAGQPAEAWSWSSSNGNPFVATIPGNNGQPGKSITLWGHAGADQEEMAKRLQALADQAQEQATRAEAQAKALHDQLMAGQAGGQNMMDLNRMMEDRMRKMEEMMQRMMERQNAQPAPAPAKKEDPKS